MTERLLAKSGTNAPSLVEHTQDVGRAFRVLFGTPHEPTRLARGWFSFFRLNNTSSFWAATEAATLFHDIGKANDRFQAAVGNRIRDSGSTKQLIRHEHLSGLILCLDSVVDWTSSRDDIDWDVVLAAVISHHCKAGDPHFMESLHRFARPIAGQRPDSKVELLTREMDFQRLLNEIKTTLALDSGVPDLPRFWCPGKLQFPECIDLRGSSLFMCKVLERLDEFDDHVGKDGNQERRSLLHAVRAALIVTDSVGSGIVRVGDSIEDWIERCFSGSYCTASEVDQKVITPRIGQLTAAGKWNPAEGNNGWSEFQVRCDALPSRSLLIAPCGSGKTLAAWRWIAAQCDRAVEEDRPVRSAIFLYPTRATASEGFRDYVSWAPEDEAGLLTGTASFDLDGMFENPDDDADVRRDRNYESDRRLFALGHWNKRFFSATVDQFLGFMQYAYGSIVLLPVLAESIVVIDEVHSFDRGLFSSLKDFLEHFDVPVLCMTASLTERRKSELLECGLELCNDKSGNLQAIADAPRYSVEWTDSYAVIDLVRQQLAAGRRVLWVVNQVARAQQAVCDIVFDSNGEHSPADLFARFGDSATISADIAGQSVPVHCFHSRFRLSDRRERHKAVVSSFQPKAEASGPLLAITTQVCEMSLDLDADVVVSELAPATALIQRMGRCNRVRMPRDAPAGTVLLYHPENERPYEKPQLDQAEDFVNRLIDIAGVNHGNDQRISQSQLESTLAEFDDAPEIHKRSQFLNSGPFAVTSESLRDGDDFTIQAVLPSDLESVLGEFQQRQPIDKWLTPISKHWKRQNGAIDARLPRHVIVAPDGHYLAAIGFCETGISSQSTTVE